MIVKITFSQRGRKPHSLPLFLVYLHRLDISDFYLYLHMMKSQKQTI